MDRTKSSAGSSINSTDQIHLYAIILCVTGFSGFVAGSHAARLCCNPQHPLRLVVRRCLGR